MMRTLYLLGFLCLLGCQRLTELKPVIDDSSTSDAEVLDVKAPPTGTLLKKLVIQSSYTTETADGPRSVFQYKYDSDNRLIRLDFEGYLYRYKKSNSGSDYANHDRRICTIGYDVTGNMSTLRMQGGLFGPSDVTFPVKMDGESFAVYGQQSWALNLFIDQPIFRLSGQKQLTHLAESWNNSVGTQFAVNTFTYTQTGFLNGVYLSYMKRGSQQPRKDPTLNKIAYGKKVINPFATNVATVAAHFLAIGGMSLNKSYLFDLSPTMPLSKNLTVISSDENSTTFSGGDATLTHTYRYTYNSRNLPVTMEVKTFYFGKPQTDTVTFEYY